MINILRKTVQAGLFCNQNTAQLAAALSHAQQRLMADKPDVAPKGGGNWVPPGAEGIQKLQNSDEFEMQPINPEEIAGFTRKIVPIHVSDKKFIKQHNRNRPSDNLFADWAIKHYIGKEPQERSDADQRLDKGLMPKDMLGRAPDDILKLINRDPAGKGSVRGR